MNMLFSRLEITFNIFIFKYLTCIYALFQLLLSHLTFLENLMLAEQMNIQHIALAHTVFHLHSINNILFHIEFTDITH